MSAEQQKLRIDDWSRGGALVAIVKRVREKGKARAFRVGLGPLACLQWIYSDVARTA